MDKSAEEEAPATIAVPVGEIQQQEKIKVRRRLVQSTLLPHKSAPVESKGDQKRDKECNEDDKGGDDVECCGSQGKKKRARKKKENPQLKPNEKENEKSSPEATPEKDATPKKSAKRAPRKNATPRKNVTPEKNGTINGKTSVHLGENRDTSLQIPNLRLEAKMMAEENSRLFGGKQIHPFFLSRNEGNKCHEGTAQRKIKSINFGPIHVYERQQDGNGAVFLDWRNWNFCEKSFIDSNCTLDGPFSSIFDCTVKSLCFNKLPNALHPSGSSVHADNLSSDEASATAMSHDMQDYQVDKVALASGCVRKIDEQQSQFLQERVASFHFGHANQLDSRLWTDRYQPKKAIEMCGNDDSVRFLSEWLRSWYQRVPRSNKDHSGGDECDIQDPDYNCCLDEEDSLKNVLLIIGPVGCGKSAAIYACAQEQGFKVLEANASECRNGIVLKEKFGALDSQSTLDSQLLQRSQESSVEFQGVDDMKSPTAVPNSKILQEIGNQAIEVIPILDEGIPNEATDMSEEFACKDNSVAFRLGQLKPLIVFEDVDVVFSEDRGFINAVQQIANKVKGPVIFTSNSDKPVLPDNLDRLELCFKMPLGKELLQHLSMVCSAEKLNVQPHLLEQLIGFCQRDIRKTITHLQFWCQGEHFRKGRVSEVQRLCSLLPFNPEAGYKLLPKMILWEFPSQLSELVEKEITMSLCTMEEVIEDKFDDNVVLNNLEKCSYGTDSIEAKKKAMLSKNFSDHEYMDFIDFFDSSSNPVPFSQSNRKRKLVVMSSDSEDELPNGRVPTTPGKDASNELCLEVDGQFPPHCLSMQKSLSPSTDLQLCSGAEKLEETLYRCSETSTELNVKDTCMSNGMSCVPESSFVPETEVNNGMEILFGRMSCVQVGHAAEIMEEASVSNEFRQHVLTIEADKFHESMPKLNKDADMPESTCDVIAELSHEEVEDSQNEIVESIARKHHLMDEYSCIDCSREVKLNEKCRSSKVTNTVRESWKNLRDCRGDLRHLVAAEPKCSEIIELVCGTSNLISEADLLQNKCQSLNSLGLPVAYSEESGAFSWCNEQLQMASAILEHGFCVYTKDIAVAGTDMGFDSRVNLTQETPLTNNKIKVGGPLGQNVNRKPLDIRLGEDVGLLGNATLPNRENPQLDIIRSMVPSRAYMVIKGNVFCEYLSSLSHMSRSESSRLSEGVKKTRRGRAARNYLSTGSLMLSPEEISLLGQSNVYEKISTQLTGTNIT